MQRLWLYHHVCIDVCGCVCVDSGARNPDVRSHMFAQSD